MKMKKLFHAAFTLIFLLTATAAVSADIKVRQKMTMGGQTFETTKLIKGSRQRTEQKIQMQDAAAADFMPQIATIMQCDLRRTIQLNDRKKIYLVEPFAEVTTTQTTAPAAKPSGTTKSGGTLTITYTATDTGERQTLFGLQARHLKITQEMESSADSCNGANKSRMEFDGWYVDFSAELSCPIDIPQVAPSTKPDCIDRIVSKRTGTANPGFLLNGTMKMYGADGKEQMTQTIETLELSRSPLAASLFDVPQDYRQVNSSQELYAMPSAEEMMKNAQNAENNRNQNNPNPGAMTNAPKSVGVNISFASNAKVNQSEITAYVEEKIRERNLLSRLNGTVANSDYLLNVEVRQAKESAAGKAGGIFGKVTGVDVKAGKTDVEIVVSLLNAKTNEQLAQNRVAQKFDGSATDAVRAALDNALGSVLQKIE
jgi:hypothetical protein